MSVAPVIAPGTVFGGDYEVERLLSAGGMGAVYVARQRSTQKHRALKTMLPELVGDPGLRERFAREASVSAHIESDHVVEVLAAGVDEAQGIPWIAMELLSGSDLAQTSRARRLGASEVIELAKQFGHALTAAHRAGVVHRDLKPENLFLAAPRREGVPFTLKVLDFGIAKITGVHTSRATKNILGSPLWMAPEQMDPTVSVSLSIDVWALGLIFFWLLTGRHYWLSGHAPDASLAMLLREILVTPLVPASERAAALGANGVLPPRFDAWFARCVNRDPAQRFRDASEAFPALLAVLDAADRGTASPSVTANASALAFEPTVAADSRAPVAVVAAGSLPRSTDASRGRTLTIALAVALFVSLGVGALAAKLRKTSRAHATASMAAQPPPPVITSAPIEDRTFGPAPVVASNAPLGGTPLAVPSTPSPTVAIAPAPSHQAHDHGPREHSPATSALATTETIRCDVEAGPLWSNADAQSRCPGVCAHAAALRFTGQWSTTRPGVMSVCGCVLPGNRRCP